MGAPALFTKVSCRSCEALIALSPAFPEANAKVNRAPINVFWTTVVNELDTGP